jgi:excisionase family DNA binding protein
MQKNTSYQKAMHLCYYLSTRKDVTAMKEQALTPDEAAKILKVSPQTIRRWLRDGSIKGTKVGGGKLWRISQATIDGYLESCDVAADQ